MTGDSPSSFTNSSDPDIEECHYLRGFVWRKMYLTDHTYRNLIALVCVNSLAIIPTILLNALVIFVVATRHRLQTTSNILLACLAGTDLLAGVVVQPIIIAVGFQRIFDVQSFCTLETVRTIAIFAQSYASLGHLVLISIDRYIAIKDPLRYREIVTKKRIKKAVLVAWAIAVVLIIKKTVLAAIANGTKTYSAHWTVTAVIIIIIACVYVAGIIYCHGYIFSETRRQKKRLQTEQVSQEEAERIRNDNRAANTLAIILVALLITYLPVITIAFLAATFSNDHLSQSFIAISSSWSSTSVLLGSLVNPIIYCWRNEKLRRAFLEICHVRQAENRAPAIEMMEIQRYRPGIEPSSNEAFSTNVVNQEPVLLSFSHLQAEIVHIEEINN